jgi:hypothetical protein
VLGPRPLKFRCLRGKGFHLTRLISMAFYNCKVKVFYNFVRQFLKKRVASDKVRERTFRKLWHDAPLNIFTKKKALASN